MIDAPSLLKDASLKTSRPTSENAPPKSPTSTPPSQHHEAFEAKTTSSSKRHASRDPAKQRQKAPDDPAIDELGLPEVCLIDPTCGSGHFLLGAFHRLLDRWRKREPATSERALRRAGGQGRAVRAAERGRRRRDVRKAGYTTLAGLGDCGGRLPRVALRLPWASV